MYDAAVGGRRAPLLRLDARLADDFAEHAEYLEYRSSGRKRNDPS
jgi:hypothetical protein